MIEHITKRFNRLSIRHKITMVVMASSIIILLLIFTAVSVSEWSTMKEEFEEDLSIHAMVIGSNSASALIFYDTKTVQETLSSLSLSPHIVSAAIYDKTGGLFAKYVRNNAYKTTISSGPVREGYYYKDGYLTVSRKISLSGDAIGSISITTDLKNFYSSLKRLAGYTAAVMIGAFFGTILLSVLLRSLIIRPILRLESVVSLVSRDKNFSLRAKKDTYDEIGSLVDGFNNMLSQIENRDIELGHYTQQLEDIIATRTNKLKKANERLVKFAQSVKNSPVSVVITDSAAKIEYVNPKFTEVTGYSTKDVVGKNPRILSSGLTQPEIYLELWKTITSGREWKGEFINKRKNKELYWESALIAPIKNSRGEITNYIAVKEDITNRKKTEVALKQAKEDAERSNRFKSEFLANMSHEIRTPMNAIIGMTDIAIDAELSSEQKERLGMIKSSAESLLDILNDILDISKVESGKLELEYMDFDLRRVIEGIVSTMSIQAKKKGLSLHVNIAPDMPTALKGDPGRLRQIIMNLVGNAVKFTKP